MAEQRRHVIKEVVEEEITYTYGPREQRTHHVCAMVILLGTGWISYEFFNVAEHVRTGEYASTVPAILPILFMLGFINQLYPKKADLVSV